MQQNYQYPCRPSPESDENSSVHHCQCHCMELEKLDLCPGHGNQVIRNCDIYLISDQMLNVYRPITAILANVQSVYTSCRCIHNSTVNPLINRTSAGTVASYFHTFTP